MVQDTDDSKGFFFDKNAYAVNTIRRHALFKLQTFCEVNPWIQLHNSHWEITAYTQYLVLCSGFNPSHLTAQALIKKQ